MARSSATSLWRSDITCMNSGHPPSRRAVLYAPVSLKCRTYTSNSRLGIVPRCQSLILRPWCAERSDSISVGNCRQTSTASRTFGIAGFAPLHFEPLLGPHDFDLAEEDAAGFGARRAILAPEHDREP